MRKFWTLTLVAVLSVAISGAAVASPITYTNEADYLSALSLTGASIIYEGFESDVWAPTRYPAFTATSVTSQGFAWTSGGDVATTAGFARTGDYGIFDFRGDPDRLYATSLIGTQVGFAGWFENTDGISVSFRLDDERVYSMNFGGSFGPHKFFGVIDTDGFTDVAMLGLFGNWGADDFTFGVISDAIPEPGTLMLVGLGLAGLGARIRRKRS